MLKERTRILLIYNPRGVVDRDICLASKNSGIEVKPFEIEVSRNPEGHTLEKIDLLGVAKSILSFNPDFVLTVNGGGLDNEGLFAHLCAFLKLPLVLWYVDEPFLIPEWGLKFIPENTIAFTFDRFYENRLKSWGIPWAYTLPLGANAERFKSYMSTARIEGGYLHPVSFVGALDYEKIQYLLQNISRFWLDMPEKMVDVLERVVPAYRNNSPIDAEEVLRNCAGDLGVHFSFPNGIVRQMVLSYIDREAGLRQRHEIVESLKPFGIGVYGEPFWEKAVGKAYYKGHINYYSPELAFLYGSTKINLNISKYQLKTTVNQRVFDCPLCDGFLITDFREDIEELFVIDESVMTFFDMDDLKKKIRYYLDHEREARKIVENGKKTILEKHTYSHRLKNLAETVGRITRSNQFFNACETVMGGKLPARFPDIIKTLNLENGYAIGPDA